MIAVIFEVTPAPGQQQAYLDLAASLRPELDRIDGFISIERFASLTQEGKILSLSFWRDEAAYVMSAEAVTVGSIGVVGATVGIGKVSQLVNDELTETACAIRSLNQSYVVPPQRGAGSWTAGSAYLQPDPDTAHAGLGRNIDETPHTLSPGENRVQTIPQRPREQRESLHL